jgi:hypothetical protein
MKMVLAAMSSSQTKPDVGFSVVAWPLRSTAVTVTETSPGCRLCVSSDGRQGRPDTTNESGWNCRRAGFRQWRRSKRSSSAQPSPCEAAVLPLRTQDDVGPAPAGTIPECCEE